MKKIAFTLAEVLITLGIIGIVAAMTLPTLVQNHRKQVVETRLAKFYSGINQAIKLAEVDYGDRSYWYEDKNTIDTDKEGNAIKGSSIVEKWWNKYLAPYIKTVKIKHDEEGLPIFYFADGSALKAPAADIMRDWHYFTEEPEKCLKKNHPWGTCAFVFMYIPVIPSNYNQEQFKYHKNKSFEPYKWAWDGKSESLYENSVADYLGCSASITDRNTYCAALIQFNGWKIPKDYPFKF